jgi:hypothetical protein
MTHYENDRTGEATRSLAEAWSWHKRGDSVSRWYGTEYLGQAFEN